MPPGKTWYDGKRIQQQEEGTMNDTWDLSILYKGFDDPAFTGDMAALDAAP